MRPSNNPTSRWIRAFGIAVIAAGAAVASIAIPAGAGTHSTWTKALVIGQVDGSTSPTVAASGNAAGDAVVVWTTAGRVALSTRSRSGSWSKATTISAANETATSPAIAVRSDGGMVLLWAAQRTSDAVVEASVRSAGGTWSVPTLVSVSGVSFAGPVRVGLDGSGTALAAWGQVSANVRSIVSASLPSGGSWTAPSTLATLSASTIRQVSLAVNASGAAVVGWIQVAGDLYGLVVTRPAGGAFGAPVSIAKGLLRPLQYQIHQFPVAIDSKGRASAAWNTVVTFADYQLADGSWAPATQFPNTGRVGNLALSVDQTDTGVLLWYDSGAVLASALPRGAGWSVGAAVLPGAAPIDLNLSPNGSNVFAGWYVDRPAGRAR